MSHHAASTNTHAPAEHEQHIPGKARAALAIALAAQILVVVDISVVNTALPTTGRALRLSGADLQWLATRRSALLGWNRYDARFLAERTAESARPRGASAAAPASHTVGS
jgi:hypothetical protein